MQKFLSPLRYPGGKNKLAKYIKKVLDYNRFKTKILVEPFVGGGSVSLNFLLNGWTEKVVIADRDQLIYSFWKTLFNNPDYLIRFIKDVDVNIENFYKYKEIATDKKIDDEKKLAEACLFLNRTSFSGILKNNAGPLGGKGQNSNYKINCRFNKKSLIEKIKYFSQFKNKVIVLLYNWKETIKYVEKIKGNDKTLFYFDPPFYKKADGLYRYYFEEKEHLILSKKIKNLKNKWILSYDRAKKIREIYKEYIRGSFAFPYSINSPAKRIEKEYFITPFKKPPKWFLTKDNVDF